MSGVLQLLGEELLGARAMFGIEFYDPFTGANVSESLYVAAKDLGPPTRTPSGRFVWNHPVRYDPRKPGPASVHVIAESRDGRFATFDEVLPIPEHVEPHAPVPPAVDPTLQFLLRHPLVATGLYEPPAGVTAYAAELWDSTANIPLEGVTVELVFRPAPPASGRARAYSCQTDVRGCFVAIARGADDVLAERDTVAWLTCTNTSNTIRYTPLLPIRRGQLVRAPHRLEWNQLLADPPMGTVNRTMGDRP